MISENDLELKDEKYISILKTLMNPEEYDNTLEHKIKELKLITQELK